MAFKFVGQDVLSELITLIKNSLAGKVDKVNGMQLSQESYTTIEKNKLATISDNAKPNVIEQINIDSTKLNVKNKIITIPMASSSVDGAMSKAHFNKIENLDSNIQQAINSAIGEITGISYEVVQSLPQPTGEVGKIYLVADSGGSGDNIYREYIWIPTGNKYECLGTTAVDISGKVDKTDLTEYTAAEVRALWNNAS